MSYPTFLIGEIWFDLQDKSLFGIMLLSLLMRFGLICRTWAFQIIHAIGSWGERIELPFWACVRAPGVYRACLFSWALASGSSRLFSNPIIFYTVIFHL